MPRLTDDGQTVVLDLHGATVDDALRLARRALTLCHGRGRHRLDVVHGSSTTERDGARRTIKTAIHAWLDGGTAAPFYQSDRRGEALVSFYFALGARADARRLTLRDLGA